MCGVIYCLHCLSTGKKYIGQTYRSLEERFSEHMDVSTRTVTKLYLAMNKYGRNNFICGIIEDNIELNNLNDREVYWISVHDTYKNGLNSTPGGEGVGRGVDSVWYGKHHKEETKHKISKANKGKKRTPEQIETMRQNRLGRKHTQESLSKISKSLRNSERTKRGSCHHRSTINEQQALEIYNLCWNTDTLHTDISEEYNISIQAIGDIKFGRTWVHVTHHDTNTPNKPQNTAKGNNNGNAKLDECKVIAIKYLLSMNKYNLKQIGIKFGVSLQSISYIKNNKSWSWLEIPDEYVLPKEYTI